MRDTTISSAASTGSTSDSNPLIDRNIRQRDILPEGKIARIHAIVIGLGAVGRPLCEQLAIMGVRKYTIFDHDVVGVENLGVQGYREKDLHADKATVCGHNILELFSLAEIDVRCARFRARHADEIALEAGWSNVVFCCVDSIEARAEIWEAMRPRCVLWIDTRMHTETVRVLASDAPITDDYYSTQLFSAAEAQSGSCTARSLVYPANLAVVLAMTDLADWLRDRALIQDQLVNLAAKEWTILKG